MVLVYTEVDVSVFWRFDALGTAVWLVFLHTTVHCCLVSKKMAAHNRKRLLCALSSRCILNMKRRLVQEYN